MDKMSDIRTALVAEIENTKEYQECLLLKQYLLDSITSPGVQQQMYYSYSQTIDLGVFKMSCKLLLGFIPEDMGPTCVHVDMASFL